MRTKPFKVLIASNKGGTGKTTIACSVATALSENHDVALLDTDVTGPNVIESLGLERKHAEFDKDFFYPIKVNKKLEAFSPSMLIPNGMAITWWGEARGKIIQELFKKVKWVKHDILVIDSPPGTSDELLTVLLNGDIDGVIIVTVGSNSAVNDAMRLVNMFKDQKFQTPIIGVVENMHPLFGDVDLSQLGVPVICQIPFSKKGGKPSARYLKPVVDEVEAILEDEK